MDLQNKVIWYDICYTTYLLIFIFYLLPKRQVKIWTGLPCAPKRIKGIGTKNATISSNINGKLIIVYFMFAVKIAHILLFFTWSWLGRMPSFPNENIKVYNNIELLFWKVLWWTYLVKIYSYFTHQYFGSLTRHNYVHGSSQTSQKEASG